jgi:hypothetical protein
MRAGIALLVGLAAALMPSAAPAQNVAAVRAPSGCTYERCALRVEEAFFSAPRLLRGRTGVEVGRLSAFGGGVDTLLAGPDSAAVYGRRYVTAIRHSTVLGLLGAAAYVVVLVRSDDFRNDLDDGSIAVAVAGTGFAIASIPFTLHAKRSLSRAVWFYNAALAR